MDSFCHLIHLSLLLNCYCDCILFCVKSILVFFFSIQWLSIPFSITFPPSACIAGSPRPNFTKTKTTWIFRLAVKYFALFFALFYGRSQGKSVGIRNKSNRDWKFNTNTNTKCIRVAEWVKIHKNANFIQPARLPEINIRTSKKSNVLCLCTIWFAWLFTVRSALLSLFLRPKMSERLSLLFISILGKIITKWAIVCETVCRRLLVRHPFCHCNQLNLNCQINV